MLNRRDMIYKKVELIKDNSVKSKTYIRNLIRRHPDLFLKSWASCQAKVQYVNNTLNRSLVKEKAFPLMLHYDFSQVIWPRSELLRSKYKTFDFVEAFSLSDDAFCQRFGFDYEELAERKSYKPQREERDKLWAYVPGV